MVSRHKIGMLVHKDHKQQLIRGFKVLAIPVYCLAHCHCLHRCFNASGKSALEGPFTGKLFPGIAKLRKGPLTLLTALLSTDEKLAILPAT